MSSRQSKRNFLFTHPRSASNLFLRILNLDEQPSLLSDAKREYFFFPSTQLKNETLGNRPINEWTFKERTVMSDSFLNCFQALYDHVREAEADEKAVFVREHTVWLLEPALEMRWTVGDKSYIKLNWLKEDFSCDCAKDLGFNTTILPHDYLLSWRPTFLIRHPALAFPSLYRTVLDLKGLEQTKKDPRQEIDMSWRWSRLLYDFFLIHHSPADDLPNTNHKDNGPIVIDADDIINDSQIMYTYCEIVGLDPGKLRFNWDAASEDRLSKMNETQKRMRSTLFASTNIVGGKTSAGIDIDVEAKKWKAEFGEEEGLKIERRVRAAMPDYLYLREQRLRSTLPATQSRL